MVISNTGTNRSVQNEEEKRLLCFLDLLTFQHAGKLHKFPAGQVGFDP